MLGMKVKDPFHFEDKVETVDGLAYLNHTTCFEEGKVTTQVKAVIKPINIPQESCFQGLENMMIKGYEIHSGKTIYSDKDESLIEITEVLGEKSIHDGGRIDSSFKVFGTYLHGLFDNDEFTQRLLNNLRKKKGLEEMDFVESYRDYKEKEYEKLERLFREHIDLDAVYSIVR